MKLADIEADTLERARNISLLVLDVDGVLSDGKLTFSNTGEEIKSFNVKDGQGIKMLQNSGITVAIITGRNSEIVTRRSKALGIELVVQGREDKLTALQELFKQETTDLSHISYTNIAYMGDDYPDLPVIRKVGLGMTPADGHWLIQQHSHWRSSLKGGEGAVREACDLLLLAQDKFNAQLEPYL